MFKWLSFSKVSLTANEAAAVSFFVFFLSVLHKLLLMEMININLICVYSVQGYNRAVMCLA